MPTGHRLRVAVVAAALPPDDWRHGVTDAVRAVDDVDVTSVAASAARIRSDDVDVVIDLAGDASIARDEVPRLGVWRYGFGDGAPVADGAPGTRARLYRITGDPATAVVLHEGWFRARTADAWGTRSVGHRVAPWCARVLRQIVMGNAAVVAAPQQATDGCRDRLPMPHPMPFGAALADTLRDWRIRQRWTIGLVPVGIEEILQRGRLPEPAWLVGQRADRFYADPFVLDVRGDHVHVMVEEYRYSSRRKSVTELSVVMGGALIGSRASAGLPMQASYPFLIRRNGRLFCLPETFRAHRLSAFAWNDAAGAWTAHRDLLEGFPCVDGTLLERDGRWWLFCTKQGDEDQTDLHVFFTSAGDDWTGPYQPHPLNPVKSDTRSSRPAGAFVEVGGEVYRPAQNCARRYGASLTINRILDLTTTSFREEPAMTLRPSPSSAWPDGMHTINSAGGLTVVDGLRIERRWGPASLVRPPRAASR
jgi:hypothetical protein